MACAVTGCFDSGPARGYVSGTVRLNGEPLPEAQLEFQPETGSPSYGETDSNGYYTLKYSAEKEGAEVGSHTVRISTFRIDTNDDGSKTEIPELVPAEFNSESTLKRDVTSGSQTIDFDLK